VVRRGEERRGDGKERASLGYKKKEKKKPERAAKPGWVASSSCDKHGKEG